MLTHRLAPLPVQACLIPGTLNCPESVTAGLALAPGRGEHEGIPVGEPQVTLCLP
jgi:hypothetical protein